MLEELCKQVQHCCATLRRSRNKRDVLSCWLIIWSVSNSAQQLSKTPNNMQQGVQWMRHATCNMQQCCVRLLRALWFAAKFVSPDHWWSFRGWRQKDVIISTLKNVSLCSSWLRVQCSFRTLPVPMICFWRLQWLMESSYGTCALTGVSVGMMVTWTDRSQLDLTSVPAQDISPPVQKTDR